MLVKYYPLPKVTEVTFRIRDAIITAEKSMILSTDRTRDTPFWCIELLYERATSKIQVLVCYPRGQRRNMYDLSVPADINLSLYKSMHLVPIGDATRAVAFDVPASALVDGKAIKGSIAQAAVKTSPTAQTSSFDVVFTTETTMARTPYNPPPPPIKNHDILPLFLKDPHSVDVCFLFPNDKVYPNYGLWAHRLVLSRNKVFTGIIDGDVRQGQADHPAVMAAADHDAMAAAVNDDLKASTMEESTRSATLAKHQQLLQEAAKKKEQVKTTSEQISIQDEDDSSSTSSFVDIDHHDNIDDFISDSGHDRSKRQKKHRKIGDSVDKAAPRSRAGSRTGLGTAVAHVDIVSHTTPDTSTRTKKETTLNMVIEKFSLETFCALLRFIYTGNTSSTIQLSQFVLSVNAPSESVKPNNKSISSASSSARTQHLSRDSTLIHWLTPSSACDNDKDKEDTRTILKDEHLMLAAHEYGIRDLAAACQERIESLMTEDDIGHILFDIVPQYPMIKYRPMQYVIRNKELLFAPGKDMFARFTTYPQCHSVMMEIFQLMAAIQDDVDLFLKIQDQESLLLKLSSNDDMSVIDLELVEELTLRIRNVSFYESEWLTLILNTANNRTSSWSVHLNNTSPHNDGYDCYDDDDDRYTAVFTNSIIQRQHTLSEFLRTALTPECAGDESDEYAISDNAGGDECLRLGNVDPESLNFPLCKQHQQQLNTYSYCIIVNNHVHIRIGRYHQNYIFILEESSLATFCARLRYIYTGKISRAIDLTDFVLSTSTNTHSFHPKDDNYQAEPRKSSLIQWYPQQGPGLKKKTKGTTTYVDLMKAATHYQLLGLAQLYEDKIVAGLNTRNTSAM
ncbi:hypothetical protein BG015_009440 [Linnemannia schmuckeri]|uniref:BTB domain-containing protein n=1 Tax=Linnemannia schmuckeri TaxID=64567 RepID=A0A9P5RY05_9FUNG|nr:hypothetical protein BG015_009440 [Linnemannia schmuckeri]